MEGTLHPGHKVARDLLEKENLDIGNIGPKAARQVEPVSAVRGGSAVRARAPAPVRVVSVAAEALGRA